LPVAAGTVQAQLTLRDDVTADKTAWAVTRTSSPLHVLLVSNGDLFLQTAFELDPTLLLDGVKPSAYRPAAAETYDLVVFDGFLPATLPVTPSLIVNPPKGSVGPLRFGALIKGGSPAALTGVTGDTGAILHYLDLSDVHIARGRQSSLPGWMQPLARVGGWTMLAAGDDGTSRYAVIPFALADSDWPLRISFPIAIQNLLAFLAPGLALDRGTLTAGQSVHFLPPPGTRQLAIHRPGGGTDTLSVPFPPFTDTDQPGLYTVRAVGERPRTASFAVDFFPPRTAPAIGPSTVWLGGSRAGIDHRVTVPVTVTWIFGILALAFLTAEWWFAFRR
jgi:Ca-activated chloride channel homolog